MNKYSSIFGCQPDEPLSSLVTTNRIINVYGLIVVIMLLMYSFLHCLSSVWNKTSTYYYCNQTHWWEANHQHTHHRWCAYIIECILHTHTNTHTDTHIYVDLDLTSGYVSLCTHNLEGLCNTHYTRCPCCKNENTEISTTGELRIVWSCYSY